MDTPKDLNYGRAMPIQRLSTPEAIARVTREATLVHIDAEIKR